MRGLSFIVLLGLVSCGPLSDDSTLRSQLTQKAFKCYDFTEAEEAAALADMPSTLIKTNGFSDSDMERIRNGLTSVPQDPRDFFYAAHDAQDFKISQRSLDNNYIGLTGYNSNWPTYLYIAPKDNAANGCFVHELGHAFDVNLRREYRDPDLDFAYQINELYNGEGQREANNKSDGLPALRDYATKTVKEYFAESYQNYYCGQEAHDYLKAKLPSTYELLSKVLKAPTWMKTSIGGESIHIALQNFNGQNYLAFALPQDSYTLRFCSTKDTSSCKNESAIPMVVHPQTNNTWKIYRTKDPVLLVNGASFPITIQGWKVNNATAQHDYQRVVELFQ